MNTQKINEFERFDVLSSMNRTFDRRRRELGMTFEALSNRSGMPISTVKNIFGKGLEHATFSNVLGIAQALGIDMDATPQVDVYDFRREQAKRKAKELVDLVRSTMAMEDQSLDPENSETMEKEMFHKLMAGSPRRLWA